MSDLYQIIENHVDKLDITKNIDKKLKKLSKLVTNHLLKDKSLMSKLDENISHVDLLSFCIKIDEISDIQFTEEELDTFISTIDAFFIGRKYILKECIGKIKLSHPDKYKHYIMYMTILALIIAVYKYIQFEKITKSIIGSIETHI